MVLVVLITIVVVLLPFPLLLFTLLLFLSHPRPHNLCMLHQLVVACCSWFSLSSPTTFFSWSLGNTRPQAGTQKAEEAGARKELAEWLIYSIFFKYY